MQHPWTSEITTEAAFKAQVQPFKKSVMFCAPSTNLENAALLATIPSQSRFWCFLQHHGTEH
jgi:hypothetical protein